MIPDLPSLLLALLSFLVTFTVARLLRKWLKRRQRGPAEAGEDTTRQSRQVRRARQRRKTPTR